jgi:hypothetical protein
VATDVEDGRIKVVVSAWDDKDRFLNDLPMTGNVIGPDMQPRTMTFRQTAPGRYVGEAPAAESGSYLLAIYPGGGRGALRSGVSVPYSAEFKDTETNFTLLGELARQEAAGGTAGRLVEDVAAAAPNPPVNSFRHDLAKVKSSQPVWPLLAFLAGSLFLADVAVRRIQISMARLAELGAHALDYIEYAETRPLSWFAPLMTIFRDRVLRRKRVEKAVPTMARLKSLKAEVSETIERRRSAARFEATPETAAADEATAEAMLADQEVHVEKAKPEETAKTLTPQAEPEDNSYTSRLLKAKKKVWEERK